MLANLFGNNQGVAQLFLGMFLKLTANIHILGPLAGRGKTRFWCHSERSEESLFDLSPMHREILRFAQNDKRTFSAACSAVPLSEHYKCGFRGSSQKPRTSENEGGAAIGTCQATRSKGKSL